MKRLIGIVLLCTIAVLAISLVAFADSDIKIYVNGSEVLSETPARIESGTTLVPMRKVLASLGADVSWNEETRTAVALKDSVKLEIQPDTGTISKNGELLSPLVAPYISQGRIIIPVRIIAEAFGFNVEWDGTSSTVSINESQKLKIHFFDCGQADSIFVELPNGKCMLIDAGLSEFGEVLVTKIREMGYEKIQYVVATHPHSDHIGGMVKVLETFEIEKFFMPEKTHTTKTFEKMLTALEKNSCEKEFLKKGTVLFENEATCIALAPDEREYSRLNNHSAVLRLEFGDISALFSADAEAASEVCMVAAGLKLKADILKVGHHGSISSSTEEYIRAVSPEFAVISVGKDNKYGFPSEVILKQLQNNGITVYRTDIDGDITMMTDGKTIIFE